MALVAVTVKVDELPALIDAGLAPMLTVGAGDLVVPVAMELLPPQPLRSRGSRRPEAIEEEIQLRDLRMCVLVRMFTFLFFLADLSVASARRYVLESSAGCWTRLIPNSIRMIF